ncbi:LPS export ABC transporter periplasmic protein LptC [Candidatus Erwinia haradaeae]|uniref:Lipopolysaccharide export system protein LptC n=1 Tax=Candidatus Erwinia haradaeae TaxID=1922217 RepID=A0A451D3P1_9GAMM|nr:LPS export ABC transporter periplasmic protein LptC [Candidatus Erwinia haradaeae]VFP80292.1 Lipopolysaccharide export system protein LptC [Candidatus Erwinia haradaeae]
MCLNKKQFIKIFLILFFMILIGWSLKKNHNFKNIFYIHKSAPEPTYITTHLQMLIYSQNGDLSNKINANQAKYYSHNKIICFIQPIVKTYDEKNNPSWRIRADQAQLTHDKILYLYGNILIKSLSHNTQIKKIHMNNAKINLITQDIISEDHIILYGHTFHATSMKLHGNLRKKTIELTDQVKSFYNTDNQKLYD